MGALTATLAIVIAATAASVPAPPAVLGPGGLRVELAEGASEPVLALVDGHGALVGVVHGMADRSGWRIAALDAQRRTRIVFGTGWQGDHEEPGGTSRRWPALFLDEHGEPVAETAPGWTFDQAEGPGEFDLRTSLRDPSGALRARTETGNEGRTFELLTSAGRPAAMVVFVEASHTLRLPLTRPGCGASDDTAAPCEPDPEPTQVVLGIPLTWSLLPCRMPTHAPTGYDSPDDYVHCLPDAGSPHRPPSEFFFDDGAGHRVWIPALLWDHAVFTADE